MAYFSGISASVFAPVSPYAPGIASGGQDFVALFVNSASGLTTNPGISQSVVTSRVFHSYSGAAVYTISSASPETIDFYDAGGKASAANITISGVGATINGATTTSISSNYGTKRVTFISGTAWIAN